MQSTLYSLFKKLKPNYEPRPQQLEKCQEIIEHFDAGKQFVVLSAPTAAGKSLIAMIIAEYYKQRERRTVITCTTKFLQEQYLKDFNIADIRSSSNDIYRCVSGFTRDMIECQKEKQISNCAKVNICPYATAFSVFMKSSIAMTNMAYYARIPIVGNTYLNIIDEAHKIQDVIISAVEFKKVNVDFGLLSMYMSNTDMKILARSIETVNAYMDQFEKEHVFIFEKIEESSIGTLVLSKVLSNIDYDTEDKMLSKAVRLLKRLKTYLQAVSFAVGSKYICIDTGVFKPIYASDFTKSMLFSKSQKTLLMSATIGEYDIYLDEIGVDKQDSAYVEFAHPIIKEKRPVVARFAASMSYKNYDSDIIKTTKAIEKLAEENDNKNMLIHTASYKRAEDLADFSKLKIEVPRDHRTVVRLLKSANSGVIVASPSVMEGIDGVGDMIRVNIIAKIPYPSLADPRMKYLMNADPNIYNLKVVRDMIQACGRGTRGVDDFSTTYIIDGAFTRLYNYNKHMFPDWFKEAVRFA